MVAVDDDGRPTGVPALEAATHAEERRQSAAQLRRSNRLTERAQVVAQRGLED
jgi:acyl-CoA hydrolase